MRNIRLILSYDGTDFNGWQRQPEAPTIQATLEGAIHQLTGGPATICASGRTDAGVHAVHQVANFTTSSTIPCPNFLRALNNLLPPTIRIKSVADVPTNFHSRYGARRKTYRYRILVTPVCSPQLFRFVYHYPYFLNKTRMAAAASLLRGEHDFTSFTVNDDAVNEREGSNVREIFTSRVLWRPRSSMLIYEVTGRGFLRYMVRNIVGTLIEVGRGRIEAVDVATILTARDRRCAGPTAPAQGLCLMRVEY